MNYTLSTTWTIVLVLAALWELAWKGAALWRAGRNNDLGWFIAILVINSIGILSIIYLLSHKNTEQKSRNDTGPLASARYPENGARI